MSDKRDSQHDQQPNEEEEVSPEALFEKQYDWPMLPFEDPFWSGY